MYVCGGPSHIVSFYIGSMERITGKVLGRSLVFFDSH